MQFINEADPQAIGTGWTTVAQFTATYGGNFSAVFSGILRPKGTGVIELRVTLDGVQSGEIRAMNIGPFLPRQDREVSIMQMLPATTSKVVRVQAKASASGLMTLQDSRFMLSP